YTEIGKQRLIVDPIKCRGLDGSMLCAAAGHCKEIALRPGNFMIPEDRTAFAVDHIKKLGGGVGASLQLVASIYAQKTGSKRRSAGGRRTFQCLRQIERNNTARAGGI